MDEAKITDLRITADGRQLPIGPVEPQMTGPVHRAIAGVRPGKVVDRLEQLGIGWTTYAGVKRRANGREEAVLEVIRAIRDLDSMASDAVWNYLRLLNPGHDLKAVTLDAAGDQVEIGGEAQAYLDWIATWVGREYGGGLDQLHNVLAITLLTTGAVALEVAPAPGLNGIEDWYPIDPALLSFKRDENLTLMLGQQFSDGSWRELPTGQVFYTPLDPDVDDPYGRPPFLSAIQPTLARAQMLNDIRAVAHNAGYPRISVEVVWEIVQSAAPPQLREPGREADFQAWAEKQLNKLVADYASLNVDDTFVHYDWVKPTLMQASGLSFDFVALDNVLQRQLNAGLKMLPILLGINEGTSETHGSVQWQIQIAGIHALQRLIKRTIEKAATLSLQLAGFAAHARMDYDETRTVDRLYEAQAELFEAQNLKLDVDQGWRTNDEAAELRTGHKAVAAPGEQAASTFAAQVAAENALAQLEAAAKLAPAQEPTDKEKQKPTEKEKQQQAAWDLLWAIREPVSLTRNLALEVGESLDAELLTKVGDEYGEQALRLFKAMEAAVIAAMLGEGIDIRKTARDIADDAFGLAYRREMKRLLREAIEDGMIAAGQGSPEAPERIVRRIWKDNERFLDKIRNDLRDQVAEWSRKVRAGEPVSMQDVSGWFAKNAERERMMGQFLSKQGFSAGYVHVTEDAASGAGVEVRFRWDLGPVKTEHCPDCMQRAGGVYTNDELLAIGFPGSISLDCASNCKCSLTRVTRRVKKEQ